MASSATSELYSVEEDKWQELPRLQKIRQKHASCAIGINVYVFCGHDRLWWSNEMIERLDLQNLSVGWRTISVKAGLTLRHSLGVAPLNEVEVLIVGGKDEEVWGDLNDLVIFNTATEKASKLKQPSTAAWPFLAGEFPCQQVEKDRVIAVDARSKRMIEYRYDGQLNMTVTILENLHPVLGD